MNEPCERAEGSVFAPGATRGTAARGDAAMGAAAARALAIRRAAEILRRLYQTVAEHKQREQEKRE